MINLKNQPIQNDRELEFAVFGIENVRFIWGSVLKKCIRDWRRRAIF